jgi:hypothetical protein
MHWKFPTDAEEKRQVLLAAVARVRDTLLARADEAEANATLPPTTVQALDDAGLFALKLPAVLGGAEADLVTQLEVLEAISYIDTSAGWCTLIGAAAIAGPGAFLADEAIAQIFAGSQVPRAVGTFMPSGQAVPVDGGCRPLWPTNTWPLHWAWGSARSIAVSAGHQCGGAAPDGERCGVRKLWAVPARPAGRRSPIVRFLDPIPDMPLRQVLQNGHDLVQLIKPAYGQSNHLHELLPLLLSPLNSAFRRGSAEKRWW